MLNDCSGKIALVTGAATGIGRSCAEALAKAGARVVLTDVDETRLQDAVAAISADGGKARALVQDVTSEDTWASVIDNIRAEEGGLNILVNNAGIAVASSIVEMSLEDFRRQNAVNVEGVFLGTKYAIPLMTETGPSSIINISSIAGLIAGHNMAAYNSAKAGVWLLSKSVALHCAKRGYRIRSNSIHPTFIDTPILDGMAGVNGRDELLTKLARQVPLGEVGDPNDVAYAVLYLASDESKFMTGAELKLDGGISAM